VNLHVKILGALYIAFGCLGFVGAFLVLTILSGDGIGRVLLFIVVVLSLPGIIVGFGLLKKYSWARILALAFGCLNLLNLPVGTSLGIYTMWVLLKEETAKLFEARLGKLLYSILMYYSAYAARILIFLFTLALYFLAIVLFVNGLRIACSWFWGWTTSLPLTQSANLNGLLCTAILVLVGAIFIRYTNLLILKFSLLYSIFGFYHAILVAAAAQFRVIIWVIIVVGLILFPPLLATSLLFSASYLIAMPYVLVRQIVLSVSALIEPYWLVPLWFPLGWLCLKIVQIFSNWCDSNFRDTSLRSKRDCCRGDYHIFLLITIISWMGMFLVRLLFDIGGWSLPILGALLGLALWGGCRYVYRILIQRETPDTALKKEQENLWKFDEETLQEIIPF
jgi:hypothetical protein